MKAEDGRLHPSAFILAMCLRGRCLFIHLRDGRGQENGQGDESRSYDDPQ